MSTPATRVKQRVHENDLDTSAWSMRERIEHAASLFLLENRERIIGPEPFSMSLRQEVLHRRLLVTNFDRRAGIYKARVNALLRVKERLDHLRRSARALETYKARRLARLTMDQMLKDVLAELKVKEAEEQGLLEDVFEVAAEIVQLGRAKRFSPIGPSPKKGTFVDTKKY